MSNTIRKREEIEVLEVQTLAPYAMKSKDSQLRFYKESQHDTRTCFQRDRDRIVHCEAFRKLEYKTQVFVIFEGDYYRTRLTHSLEVAQIARSIGRNLRLNEDLIEAIALAHDLGHAPFGHAGEDILNKKMKSQKLDFNHNFRSYEIVTKIEKRYSNFPGLNLTKEVRIGILKHDTPYDHHIKRKSDIPTFQEDDADKPTLEARVVDIADSLAYLNHDIDDGLTSGCITEQDLTDNDLWKKALERIKGLIHSADKNMLKYQIVKELIDMQVKDLMEASSQRLSRKDFRSADEAKTCKEKIINFGEKMARLRTELQALVEKKLYHHYRVERMTSKAKRIIDDLFGVYKKNPNQLPYSVYARDRRYNKKEKYEIICNYIASMTDRFALDEHKRLFNPYEKV
ncbi:MAG: deoxyguanosinetriphosphate triphosphohydrolase [Candidatus Omnitrophota bacterium]